MSVPGSGNGGESTSRSAGTKADEIATALEEAIAAGKIPAGTVLRQDQLSAEFSVSRTPVREALRKVAAVGLVAFTPNRGVRVLPLDPDRVHQAYLVRAELDGLGAELAASRISADGIAELEAAEAEFGRLTQRLQQPMADTERQSVTFAWLSANNRFHDGILAAAAAPLVFQTAKSIRNIVSGQPLWTPNSELGRLHALSSEEHSAILHALKIGSAAGARALAREHVQHAWQIVELTLAAGGHDTAAPPLT